MTYAKGLGVHALSDVRFALGGVCSLMTAKIGLDDEVGANGSVIFQVFGDSATTPLYDSGLMVGTTATKTVSVNITGVNTLRLVVGIGPEGNSSDHADWADAMVTCSTGGDTTPPTVTAVSPAPAATGVVVNTNVIGTFSEAVNAATLTAATVTLTAAGTWCRRRSPTTRRPHGDARPDCGSARQHAVYGDYQERRLGREGPCRQCAGGRSGVDVHDRHRWSDGHLSERSTWTEIANGWGPVEKDRSNGQTGPNDGITLRLNGVTYAKGLGTHAESDIRFALAGACSLLTAQIGIDDEITVDGSVIFQVYADGSATPLYDSGVMTSATATKSLSVNLTGVNTLRLVVTGGPDGNGSDHADWADAS